MKGHSLEIEELIHIDVNGTRQSILIRGCNINHPVLLYLHGGPGVSNMYMYPYEKNLEKNFVVIKWDQRGTAKSYTKDIDKETLTLNQFILDAYEVCKYISNRFQKKIYLIGYSWGSLLGIKIIHKYPDIFEGFIGVSQVVNDLESEKISYKYILNKAKLKENKYDIYVINKIMNLSYRTIDTARYIEKLIQKYGGSFLNKKHKYLNILRILICKYYSIFDIVKFIKGLNGYEDLMKSIIEVNLFKLDNKFEIPVYFFVGKHDYITSSLVTQKYYEFIIAPKKKIVYFNKSAHCPNIEEYEKFNYEVIKCFLNKN